MRNDFSLLLLHKPETSVKKLQYFVNLEADTICIARVIWLRFFREAIRVLISFNEAPIHLTSLCILNGFQFIFCRGIISFCS